MDTAFKQLVFAFGDQHLKTRLQLLGLLVLAYFAVSQIWFQSCKLKTHPPWTLEARPVGGMCSIGAVRGMVRPYVAIHIRMLARVDETKYQCKPPLKVLVFGSPSSRTDSC